MTPAAADFKITVKDIPEVVETFKRLVGERDRARSAAVALEQQNAQLRCAVLTEVRDQLEQSDQLAAARFVGRMITKEQQK